MNDPLASLERLADRARQDRAPNSVDVTHRVLTRLRLEKPTIERQWPLAPWAVASSLAAMVVTVLISPSLQQALDPLSDLMLFASIFLS